MVYTVQGIQGANATSAVGEDRDDLLNVLGAWKVGRQDESNLGGPLAHWTTWTESVCGRLEGWNMPKPAPRGNIGNTATPDLISENSFISFMCCLTMYACAEVTLIFIYWEKIQKL